MHRANKTINTKVGLDLPMSEQVRQRQVTLMKEKRPLIPRECTVLSLEMKRVSCLLRLSLLPEMEQRARIFMSEYAMTTRIKMSGNRLVSIVGRTCTTMLTEPCPKLPPRIYSK